MEGTRPLVTIVPNFSEGRRTDVIEAIVAALQVPGVVLLARQADPEHNRLDCTLVGDADAVRRSALAGTRAALELIDMDAHRGSHPRMGAVDVIPFVPVRGITMQECVALARSLAEELGATFGLPVYCYGEAALSPERRELADVRSGEYEGLRDAVARGERLPDFGPHAIGKAGAVAVGARKPLIAFNVYLSGDEEGARAIARAVRESSGGLAAVRAIGFAVPDRGCVTVSMNLVDHQLAPPRRAFDAVGEEAARRGMQVLSSEIVGLAPAAALREGDIEHLRLEGFDADAQILERAVTRAEERLATMRLDAFLDRLASADATPGGGAVAAVAGAAGAALIAMVARLTSGRAGFEDVTPRMDAIVADADAARAAFLELAERDAAAFEAVMTSFRLPKETDEERSARAEAIQRAFAAAAEEPLKVARLAVGTMRLAAEVTRWGNPNASSDGASAAAALSAAVRAAAANVEINAASLKDERAAAELRREVASLRSESDELLGAAEAAFRERSGGP